jgi:DNA polymerase
MKRLYTSLNLKKTLMLKALGVDYIEPIASFKEPEIALPNRLNELNELIKNCYLCELSKGRKNTVFGEGNLDANIMFVGEAPGASEDNSARPFMGRTGELLTKMIENVLDIKRDEVYITNILKCQPLKGKAPTANEILTCKPYLQKQIQIVKPKLIVTLGDMAYSYLTNDNTPITQARGHIFDMQEYKVLPTFHPSYLLRNPSAKKEAFADMLKVKEFLKTI